MNEIEEGEHPSMRENSDSNQGQPQFNHLLVERLSSQSRHSLRRKRELRIAHVVESVDLIKSERLICVLPPRASIQSFTRHVDKAGRYYWHDPTAYQRDEGCPAPPGTRMDQIPTRGVDR